VGRKEEKIARKRIKATADVFQLISREILLQFHWELSYLQRRQQTFGECVLGCGGGGVEGGTETATLLDRDTNVLYLWNGFYVYVYVSAIIYS
jgi:hypothetical protein